MRRKRNVIATSDVSPLIRGTQGKAPIKRGDVVTVKRGYWYNGEGWYEFTDGRHAPDILFDETT